MDEMGRGYDRLRQNPVAWYEELAERQALAGTLLDGLDLDELWTDDSSNTRD